MLSSCAPSSTSDIAYDYTEIVEDLGYYEKFRDSDITLNVYNWGEYISDGTEGSLDVIAAFEEVSGISVNYTNYATNEDLYTKLKSGSTSVYDIIIPSDYMISKMISEDMLEELNFDNIPNFKYIDEAYRAPDFDPEGKFSVPYTWGTVGIVYNKDYVTEPVDSWNVLWDEKYSGQILMFSNSRDAFAIALAKLGYSLNTEDPIEIEAAAEELRRQKPVVQTYVMDQVFDKMELVEAYVAPYYAGDAVTMIEKNASLAFAYPKETNNIFIDSICIPKGSKNKEAAEAFINFLCETEVAVANCEYICYSTPHTEAKNILTEDMEEWQLAITYPEDTTGMESFRNLSPETNENITRLWNDIRVTNEDSWTNKNLVPVTIIIGLGLVILIILMRIRKARKKVDY